MIPMMAEMCRVNNENHQDFRLLRRRDGPDPERGE